MAPYQFPAELSSWITSLAVVLDARVQCKLVALFLGVLFARGRRTVTSWLRVIGVREEYEEWYCFLGSIGRACDLIARTLVLLIARRLPPDERILLALDDTPTERYGPKIEGAGIHHNPTPGPADQKHLYGHVWVTIAWVLRHPSWGTIGLPLLARLYVRMKNLPILRMRYGWEFRTKLELAADMVEKFAGWLKRLGKPLWIVADGAYAKREFLSRAKKAGATVVSRLRKDAALYSVPKSPPSGKRGRGRPRLYGAERISLAKRAGHSRGWKTGEFLLYGKCLTKKYKAFHATYPPAGGLILVVLTIDELGDWIAYFCTEPTASVESVLEAVADRSAIEQVFHDVKEVHGSGQQQLRNVWKNIGAWHMILWMHTLVELWAWDRPMSELCDRSDSPWDDADRRPSHANRCKALRERCIRKEISQRCGSRSLPQEIAELIETLADRAA
jgi:DDE superfamily endonuclease